LFSFQINAAIPCRARQIFANGMLFSQGMMFALLMMLPMCRQFNVTDIVDAICIPAHGTWHDFCFISSSFSMGVGFPAVLP